MGENRRNLARRERERQSAREKKEQTETKGNKHKQRRNLFGHVRIMCRSGRPLFACPGIRFSWQHWCRCPLVTVSGKTGSAKTVHHSCAAKWCCFRLLRPSRSVSVVAFLASLARGNRGHSARLILFNLVACIKEELDGGGWRAGSVAVHFFF